MSRPKIPYALVAEEIVAALDAGTTQREVAERLGYSQAWVNRIARWYLAEIGETRWWVRERPHDRSGLIARGD